VINEKNSILHFLNRFNHLSIFDTALWPQKEFLIKLSASIIIISLLIHRIPVLIFKISLLQNNFQYSDYGYTFFFHFIFNNYLHFSIIFLENIILITYLFAYVTRISARNNAHTFMETIFPFFIAYIPIIISLLPYNSFLGCNILNSPKLQNIIFFIILIGYILNIISLITIRKSFAVMIESRYFIKNGIYRFIRHPAYLSHLIIFFGFLILHFSPLSLALYIIFVTGQILRAKMEENKLIETFPDYITYKNKTGMFIPSFNRLF